MKTFNKIILAAFLGFIAIGCAPNPNNQEYTTQSVPPHPPPPPPHQPVAERATGSKALVRPSPGSAYLAQQQRAVSALHAPIPIRPVNENRDNFKQLESNPLRLVNEHPVSTFSIDVDTSSYTFVRRQLQQFDTLPQKDQVRLEEMVNYFDYQYRRPQNKQTPFEPNITVLPAPWAKGKKLLHIGIKGHQTPAAKRPKSNLVFLIDTSGSMSSADKLPLLIKSFKLLIDQLDKESSIAIVTYAGSAGLVLEPTKIHQKSKILAALERLQAGGSTAGEQGIQLAYKTARQHFDKNAINRILLATDGDFNVGINDPKALKEMIKKQRRSGIYLSVLGFGTGNYQDELMQELAQNGNGNAAYIDKLTEARKVLVHEASSTLYPIANDVKIQVEFNPAKIAEYRLLGYESRLLKREDFNNDKVDAGDIGSGHSVTAIYEITEVDSPSRMIDPSRYTSPQPSSNQQKFTDEYAFLKIRYKLPGTTNSQLIQQAINSRFETPSLQSANPETQFAIAVAAFAQKLRNEDHIGDYGYDDIITLATRSRGRDVYGYRAEFIELLRRAKELDQ